MLANGCRLEFVLMAMPPSAAPNCGAATETRDGSETSEFPAGLDEAVIMFCGPDSERSASTTPKSIKKAQRLVANPPMTPGFGLENTQEAAPAKEHYH